MKLNPQKAYQQQRSKKLKSAETLDEALFNAVDSNILQHIQNTYSHQDDLRNQLKIIQYYLLDRNTTDDIKTAIKLKLSEGAANCSPGFHTRCKYIVLGLHRPQTLDEFLEKIRIGITDSVAHECTGEVHLHNSFFYAAQAHGFGVNPLNEKDVYSSKSLNNSSHRESLENAIKNRYNAISILSDLPVYLKDEFSEYYGYKGKINTDNERLDSIYAAGYPKEYYDEYLEILKQVLLVEQVDIAHVLLTDDDGKVVDLNWPNIQKALLEALEKNKYCEFTADEKQFLSALFAGSLDLSKSENLVLLQALELQKYSSLIQYLSESQKESIIKAIFEKPGDNMSFEDLYQLINKYEFFEKNPTTRLEFGTKQFSAWLRVKKNQKLFITNIKKLNKTKETFGLLKYCSDNLIKTLNIAPLIGIKQLHLAVKSHPAAVAPLLDAITKLNVEHQGNILSAKNNYGRNALMEAAGRQPTAVAPLLDAIVKLDVEHQGNILSAKNNYGRNALMEAAGHQPTAVAPLLDAITKLNVEHQVNILSAKNDDGYNALITAERFQPAAVAPLLDAITKLNVEHQGNILSAKNNDGYNALITAARFQPAAVAPLLDAIAKLDVEHQVNILSAKNNDGYNALIIAARFQPAAVAPLLDAITKLNVEHQVNILSAKNNDGYNALITAASDQPTAVAPLLDAITKLNVEHQGNILSAKNNYGRNALMEAAGRQPTAVAPLLDAIAKLDVEHQGNILSAKNNDGYNALMKAAGRQPTAVAPLLDAIAKLDVEHQVNILSAKNNDGYNALITAERFQPAAVAPLLDAIAKLDVEHQVNILSAKNNDGCNALMYATGLRPAAVAALFDAIAKLGVEHRGNILSAKDNLGWNALMFAAASHPAAVAPLLDAIAKLDVEHQGNILSAKNKDGCNALMEAARFQPTAVAPLLDAITKLDVEHQVNIFSQKTENGRDASVLFKRYHPSQTPFVVKPAENDVQEYQKLFLAMHKNRISREVFKFFRSTKLNPQHNLQEIMQHAAKNNNRSRKILVSLGWMNDRGGIPDYAPDVIKNIGNVTNEQSTLRPPIS